MLGQPMLNIRGPHYACIQSWNTNSKHATLASTVKCEITVNE